MQQQRIVEHDAAPEAERRHAGTSAAAHSQCPCPTNTSPAVAAAPSTVNDIIMRTRAPLRSAIAPSAGASTATTKLATPLTMPRRNVLSVATTPAFQYCLKKTGKNPAITVVANAELAQS